jgi:alkanesulfonate monooxygenase SsuD/methylene tetrahydromethanopterin reductase-like flavin-dependent oxidoreductase (luciferase family)
VSRGRGALFERKLDVLRRLLAGESVSARGPGFRLEGARLSLTPKRPMPFWIAANGDAAVRRAARLGDAWLMNPHSGLGELGRQLRLFQCARSDAGLAPAAEQPITREVCVRRSDADAVAAARPWIERKYAAYVEWGQDETMPRGETLRRPWDELAADGRFIVGSPETCIESMRRHQARLGVTDMLCRVQWPGLPQHEALESLRMLGKEVLPVLTADASSARPD